MEKASEAVNRFVHVPDRFAHGRPGHRRAIDDELDELLAAIEIEGPKAVGKTVTAHRRSRTAYQYPTH